MSLATAVAKARLVTRDYGDSFHARVIGNGETVRFDLPSTNIDTTTLVVYTKVGSTVTMLTPSADITPAAGEYYIEPRDGVVTLGAPLASGALLVVEGIGAFWTLPDDLETFVEIAFDLHARGRTPALTWDNLSPAEEYAIALLAVREALWAQISEAASQVDITTPEGIHIPAGQHYAQLRGMLDWVESQYHSIAGALNVGPWAIEMYTLRRVSRTTNRLVPIYLPREIENTDPPVRVYPPINPGV